MNEVTRKDVERAVADLFTMVDGRQGAYLSLETSDSKWLGRIMSRPNVVERLCQTLGVKEPTP
jgi:hypothetical protein